MNTHDRLKRAMKREEAMSVTERPILFSGPMVRAILAGRKTMTRRVVKGDFAPDKFIREKSGQGYGWYWPNWKGKENVWTMTGAVMFARDAGFDVQMKSPYGVSGDRLWVKEASWRWGKWMLDGETKTGRQKYRFKPVGDRKTFEKPETTAKRDGSEGWVYRHARYMPRSECRILLEITDVRVERLQEITEEDARAEGFPPPVDPSEYLPNPSSSRDRFKGLWEEINGKRGYDWDANPWVSCVSFRRLEAPHPSEVFGE